MNAVSRRTALLGGLAAAGAGLLTACGASKTTGSVFGLPSPSPLAPPPGGRVVTATLTPRPVTLDLGGPKVATWAYGDTLPGPLIRATAGDLLRIRVDNQLPSETSVHWHGVAVRNAADGVPGLTQEAITAGASYSYEFIAPDAGTYFYHPHVGVQLDRGLYAPLIVDDPDEPGEYDAEWIVVLDDWIDGTGTTPDAVLANLIGSGSGAASGMSGMSGMGGMNMGSGSSPFGDAGDVTYPYFLINGCVGTAPQSFRARPGQRIRIRLINAASDTIFVVALGGHRMRVTHTDGFAVAAHETAAVYLGMGERYDVVVTAQDGVFPLVAKPVNKSGQALALLRTGQGAAPSAAVKLRELDGPITTVADLTPASSAMLPAREIGQRVELQLVGQMSPYAWGINGAPFPDNKPIELTAGERVRVKLSNATMMTHPVHIHGHTFALPNGLRKDTVLLTPMQALEVDLQADNPGNWAAHCHNIYHAEAGMMTALVYAADHS